MPRPVKCRRVAFMPGLTYFKPAGVPLRLLDDVRLSIEEVEAISLKDIDDLDQEQCAEKMNISRPTFQRVLESARKKIADALLNGKAMRIEGGNFEVAPLHFRCLNNHEWNVQFDAMINEPVQLCPTCKNEGTEVESMNVSNRCFRHDKGAKGDRCCFRQE